MRCDRRPRWCRQGRGRRLGKALVRDFDADMLIFKLAVLGHQGLRLLQKYGGRKGLVTAALVLGKRTGSVQQIRTAFACDPLCLGLAPLRDFCVVTRQKHLWDRVALPFGRLCVLWVLKQSGRETLILG